MADADTWMPLYIGDYLRDTGHLTTLEHGAYFLLLMQAWTRGGVLPADSDRLRAIARMDAKDWKRSGPVLMEFFHRDGDVLRNKRLTHELANATAVVEQRRAAARIAGKASAEARTRQRSFNENPTAVGKSLDENSTDVERDVERDGQRNGNRTSTPSPSPSPKDSSSLINLFTKSNQSMK